MRTRTWAPIATFVAVAGLGGAAALLTGGEASSNGPRNLRLVDAGGSAASRSSAATGDYVLDVTLPTDKPADQRAYDLSSGPADGAVVARLAKALHEGTPERDGDGWRAGGLVVSGKPGQAWSWSPCAKDAAVGSDGSVSCGAVDTPTSVSGSGSASSSGSGVAVAPLPAVSASPQPAPTTPPDVPAITVREGTREVFSALGLDADDATVTNGPYGGDATIQVAAGGVRTWGLVTGVTVGQDGTVNGGSGFLGTATAGDSYPVVSARDAFDELPALAHPDICQLPPDGSSGCVEPEKTHITGAVLGLSLQHSDDGGAVLVPSWLFTTKHGDVAAVAVEQRYRSDDQPTAKPTDKPTEIDPGTVDPAPPAREPVEITGAYRAEDDATAVKVSYDDGGCGHQHVTAQAKEDETTVYVLLEADPVPPNQACTRMARTTVTTVDLQAPLGDRTVVDASTNQPVGVR